MGARTENTQFVGYNFLESAQKRQKVPKNGRKCPKTAESAQKCGSARKINLVNLKKRLT